jgi:adenylate cyclase
MGSFSPIKEVIRASELLTSKGGQKPVLKILTDQLQDICRSDLTALYIEKDGELRLISFRGKYQPPKVLEMTRGGIEFILDEKTGVFLNDRNSEFFQDVFLFDSMNSGALVPICTQRKFYGAVFLNHRQEGLFGHSRLQFIEGITTLCSNLLESNSLFEEVKMRLNQIEELHLYQDNIFSSMSNILITLNMKGEIEYFNQPAAEKFQMDDTCLGKGFYEFFGKAFSRGFYTELGKARKSISPIAGFQGIYKSEGGDMDYSVSISALKGRRGKDLGLTIIFTDQTREKELQSQMVHVQEERRQIKDMFARYISADVLNNLLQSPESVKLGGDRKMATIFFADISGYTKFSESKEPEFIIDVLNEFFAEAVEVIIGYNGYIDKYIGDCIMAVWGVPMYTVEKDAQAAVSCALEIQELVKSPRRNFFKNEAKDLQIAIGIHTGPLVAGNLGSSRRMDYSVIGDTVNVAARLEGVAQGGEIIITEETRVHLGSGYSLDPLKPVQVKGKERPLQIYKVR